MGFPETGVKLVVEGADEFNQIVTGAFRYVGELAVQAVVDAGRAMVDFGAQSIGVAADYESTLNQFASVTGDALAGAGMELSDFSALFLQMGADTKYSAAEAAQAAVELAKGGLDPATIAAGGLEAALALAAAGSLDLAVSAEITAKQLGVWSDTGVQAADVANLMARAANASTVGVEDLALGMANVGGAAKTAGLSFEETTTALALLAPGFSSSADAGTSFKTFITSLIPKSAEAAEAMQSLGLATADGTSVFFDAQGNFIGMEQAAAALNTALYGTRDVTIEVGGRTAEQNAELARLQKLLSSTTTSINDYSTGIKGATLSDDARNNKLADLYASQAAIEAQVNALLGIQGEYSTSTVQLTDEQRLMALQTIFGADALRAAAILAESGAEGYNAMATAMNGAGTAAEQAAMLNQGFNFAMESLGGSIETVQILIGQAFLPVLTDMLNSGIIPVVNVIMEWAQAHLPALQAALSALASEISTNVAVVMANLPALIADVTAFMQPMTDGAVALASAFLASMPQIEMTVVDMAASVTTTFSILAPEIVSLIGDALTTIAEFWTAHGTEIMSIVGGAFEAVTITIGAALTFVAGFITITLNSMSSGWTAFTQLLSGDTTGAFATILTTITANMDTAAGVVDAVLNTIAAAFGTTWPAVQETVATAWASMQTTIDAALTDISNNVITTWFGVQSSFETTLQAIANNVTAQFFAIQSSIVTALSDTYAAMVGQLAVWQQAGADLIAGVASGIADGLQGVIDAAVDVVNAAINAAKGAAGIKSPSKVAAEEIGKPIAEGVAEGIDDGRADAANAMKRLTDQMFDIGGAASALGNTAAKQIESRILKPGRENLANIEKTLAIEKARSPWWFAEEEHASNIAELERARQLALDEIVENEERLEQLRYQQEQLGFLQQQMRLLDMVREYGLNSQDIFGGLTLGVNAEITDLVDAMTRAINAVVRQVNDQLQIASPSRVFADIGGQIMAGLASGILSATADPLEAMSAATNAIMTPTMSAAQQVAYNNSTSYNLTVNSAASSQGVVSDFSIMQAMTV